MSYDTVIQLTSEALMLCLLLSLPAVAVSAIVGLLVSLVQAVTSLQDAAISQGVKLCEVTRSAQALAMCRKLVVPTVPNGMPAAISTTSPGSAKPSCLASEQALNTMSGTSSIATAVWTQ